MLKSPVSEMPPKTMKRGVSLLLLVAVLSFAAGCSSDHNDGTTDPMGGSGPTETTDPTTLCSDLATAICSKLYGCYTAEQLASMTAVAAHDEAGCVTQWTTNLDCATDPTDCKAGQTYDSAKGQECVNGYKAFTCTDFKGYLNATTPPPSACAEGCK